MVDFVVQCEVLSRRQSQDSRGPLIIESLRNQLSLKLAATMRWIDFAIVAWVLEARGGVDVVRDRFFLLFPVFLFLKLLPAQQPP